MEPTELITPPPPEQPPPGEPPPRRELWPWLIVLLLLVLAGLAAAWYATRDTSSSASTPRTRLTTVAAAARPNQKAKKQTQTTEPTTTTTVAQVAVPDLVGQTRDEAIRTLEAQGLKATVAEVPSTEEKELVVAQHPDAGTKVDKGAGVTVNVSTGPAEPTTSVSRPKPTPKPKPLPKAKPAKTSAATPQQPATATVPSVIGEDELTASGDLESAGFNVASVDQPTSDQSRDGVVIDQSPSGGSSADENSTVTIYVARYSSTG